MASLCGSLRHGMIIGCQMVDPGSDDPARAVDGALPECMERAETPLTAPTLERWCGLRSALNSGKWVCDFGKA